MSFVELFPNYNYYHWKYLCTRFLQWNYYYCEFIVRSKSRYILRVPLREIILGIRHSIFFNWPPAPSELFETVRPYLRDGIWISMRIRIFKIVRVVPMELGGKGGRGSIGRSGDGGGEGETEPPTRIINRIVFCDRSLSPTFVFRSQISPLFSC